MAYHPAETRKGGFCPIPCLVDCPVLNMVYTFSSEYLESLMVQGVKRTQCDDSLTFKLAVVEQIEKGELTCSQAQARVMVSEAVDIYNTERPHQALKYNTPDAVHRGVLSGERLAENV